MMRKSRTLLAATCCAALLLVSACATRESPPLPPPDSPATASAPTPSPSETIALDPLPVQVAPWLAMAGYQPVEREPITFDVPTYSPEPDPPYFNLANIPQIPRPQSRGAGTEAILGQLAASIAKSGKPDVPTGVEASLVGVMEGNRYVYLLGGPPTKGVDSDFVYMLEQQDSNWKATPICFRSWQWVWAGTLTQPANPVVICATVEGSGAVMTLSAYKAGQAVLLFNGLEESGLRILPQGDQPPTIVAYGALRWLNHKLDPWVAERFTFTWDGARYVTKYERLADWRYHLARFVQLVAGGMPEKAAAEMSAPPTAGLAAYLAEHAPDLKVQSSNTLSTFGHMGKPGERVWLHQAGDPTTGPWFWFDFNSAGKITAVGQQAEEPK